MNKIEVILKVTNACNLRCKYCYNSGKGYEKDLVSLSDFEKLLTVLLGDYHLIHIIWHGGEPLMAGLDFFKAAMDVEERVRLRSSVVIENSIQTNGTLIDAKWIAFFKEYGFRVGISFDGVENEKYRQGTQKTLAVMQKLKAEGVKFSCLAVVADRDYDLGRNYDFFRGMGLSFDFSYVFREGAAREMGGPDPEAFADACIALFDRWLFDTEGVSVRKFAMYICMAVGGNLRICECSSCHTKYICLTPDGTLYNCGREGLEAYPFGKIGEVESVKEIFASEGARALLKGSVERRKQCAQHCEYFDLCRGGCADIAISEGDLSKPPRNYCTVFKKVYGHIAEKIKSVFSMGVPLDSLNPAVRGVLAKSIARECTGMKGELSDSYLRS